MLKRPWPLLFIVVCVLLMACSNTPTTPEGNVPFTDAKNNFKASDYSAALVNLDKTIKWTKDESIRQQAIVLRTVLVTALADSYRQMAEAYYTGAKQPAGQPHAGAFSVKRSDYYKTAQGYLMDGMQATMDQRAKLGSSTTPIEVIFPGFMATNPGMTKIKLGQAVTDSEGASAELQAERNALAVALSAVAGAGQDPNKGQQAYSSGKVDVDPRVYIIELSNSFMQSSVMFDYRGLNAPDRMRTVNEVVKGNLEVAEKLLAAKPDKDLEARVKKMQADCDKALKPKTK